MVIQAKELLNKVMWNKHYLTEEETQRIVSLGLKNELDRVEKYRDHR
jgi:hypothetical protein